MTFHQPYFTDVLVIGAGLAGERTAIELVLHGLNVTILSLVPPRRSHSTAAQGGMQAALGNCALGRGDTPDLHFADTVRGSDWGCDQDVARLFVEAAPVAVRQTAHWGVPWSRVTAGRKTLPDGRVIDDLPECEGLITARDFGGTAKWRTCYTADGTGHSLQYTLDSMVISYGITVHDRMEAISLIHDGTACLGAVARCLRTGTLRAYVARTTVIATGGYGRLYGITTNAVICDGTGSALALDTSLVPLGNMEAVQFHPTGLVPAGILITEGARGDGGYLLDRHKHRFMPDYEPVKRDLASRDVVARRMLQHIRKGLGVDSPYGPHLWLDIRHLGAQHINTNLREIAGICRSFAGLDPVRDLIPVRPTQHYSMGGVRTDIDGKVYGLEGLFAVGEAACWDLHGFNRLGGNSLAETIVMGMIVGRKVAQYAPERPLSRFPPAINATLARERQRIDDLISGRWGRENVFELRQAMEQTLMDYVGIFRNQTGLQEAVNLLQELLERSQRLGLHSHSRGASPELAAALRLPGMLRQALCIACGALQRTESRGSHFREDYPRRDDVHWLQRTLAYWPAGADRPRLAYEPVTITAMPPGDRGYGEASFVDS